MAELQLSDRDLEVARGVVNFGYVSMSHIADLWFHGLNKKTAQRCIDRLVSRGYLHKVERYRVVGGSVGGSGQFVYMPGASAHYLFGEGVYKRANQLTGNALHSLEVTDIYVRLVELHRAGKIVLHTALIESDAYIRAGEYLLEPDLLLHIALPNGVNFRLQLEVDRDMQSKTRIHKKLANYYRAAQPSNWSQSGYEKFPGVLFIAPDEGRQAALQAFIQEFRGQLRADVSPSMFNAVTKAGFLSQLSTDL